MPNAWIAAARLRTLPLAASSIIAGSGIAYTTNCFSWTVAALTLVTALLLQILSNFANDYGDFVKGTDNENRKGPMRTMQSGAITKPQMRNAIIIIALATLSCGIALVITATKGMKLMYPMLFIILGLIAIAAAIKYTVGKNAYGYAGLGDLFVFLFFGWVAVGGTYWLQTHEISYPLILPASAFGMLSMGVLNLNNMRDIENDAKMGKRTIPVKIGIGSAKVYHTLLLLGAILMLFVYTHQVTGRFEYLISIAAFPIAIVVGSTLNKGTKTLDPLLKLLGLATLLTAILLCISLITATG